MLLRTCFFGELQIKINNINNILNFTLSMGILSKSLYSAIMLGILLPKLNIYMTKHGSRDK